MVDPDNAPENKGEEQQTRRLSPGVVRQEPNSEDDEPGNDRPDVPQPDRTQQIPLAHQLEAVEFQGSCQCQVRGHLAWRGALIDLDYDAEHSCDDEGRTGARHRGGKLEDVKGEDGDCERSADVLAQVAALDPFLKLPRPAGGPL